MKLLTQFVRGFAVLAGLFLVASALIALLGMAPESNGPVPFPSQMSSALLPTVFGLVLLAPQGRFRTARSFYFLLSAHVLLAALLGFRLVQTVNLVRGGELAVVAIPVALAFFGVPVLNGVVLWLARRPGTPPNNSSKPTPLRGAA